MRDLENGASWWARLLDRIIPLLVAGLTFPLFFVTSWRTPWNTLAGVMTTTAPPWVMAVAALLCALCAGVARRVRWPLSVLAAVVWVLFSAWAPGAIASYYAGTARRRRWESLAFLLAGLALVAVPASVGIFTPARLSIEYAVVATLLVFAVFVALPYIAGLWVGARREVVLNLRDRAALAEHDRALRVAAARSDERARIAREMHDVVAHRVSLMVLHAGALEVSAADDRTAAAAALIRSTGREALTDLRRVLGVLRHARTAPAGLAPQPALRDLDALLDRVRSAGMQVARVDEGESILLPSIVERTAYRVIQEALTNVAKHAGGADTTVSLRFEPGLLHVTVQNAPPGHAVDPMPGSGLGLVGLRERVQVLDGQLTTQHRFDGGYLLAASIPTGATDEAMMPA